MKILITSFIALALVYSFITNAHAMEAKSGYEFLTTESKEMQDDDFANPGLKALEDGRKWYYDKNLQGKNCVSCHGEDGSGFDKKSLASYPKYNNEFERPFSLQDQINYCWEENLDNVPYIYDCPDLLELEVYIRNLAKDEKVNVVITDKLKPFYEKGKQLYNTRFGQINMSCASCHDQYSGLKLRGQVLSQGQSNGYPAYRLGSGKITGLHSRFAECFTSFRAEPFDRGSMEYISLELFLNARGNNLKIETPGVRY